VASVTKEELVRLAAYGANDLVTKKAAKDAEEAKPKTDKKETTDERIDRLEKSLADKDARIAANQKDEKILSNIASEIGKHPELKGWDDDVAASIIGAYAIARKENPNPDLNTIIQTKIKSFKERIGPKIDPEKKLEDAEKTALTTASGKGGGTVKPVKLGRQAFRDGSLGKQVLASYERKLKEIKE